MQIDFLLDRLNNESVIPNETNGAKSRLGRDSATYPTERNKRLVQLITACKERFAAKEAFLVRAPGRVNLIGEHTDYNGYPVMPIAINREIRVCVTPNNKPVIEIANLDDRFPPRQFAIDSADIQPYVQGDWGNYTKAAVVGLLPILAEHGKSTIGFSAVYSGDIPAAAGLSSSSALVVAAALTFLHANKTTLPPTELAELLARAERFVGTEGGGMDQAISIMGKKNRALKIDFFPLRSHPVPIPADYEIVICNSLISAPKTERAMNDYNRRPVECRIAAALIAAQLQKQLNTEITTSRLADVDIKNLTINKQDYDRIIGQALTPANMSLEQVSERLSLSIQDTTQRYLTLKSGAIFQPPIDGFKVASRYRHVLSEAIRVEQAAQALAQNEVAEFGRLMNASHQSCRDDYEISTAELDALVEIALSHHALGARLTGAGFGGCTVNLVHKENVPAFIDGVMKDYYLDYLRTKRPEIRFNLEDREQIIFSSPAVQGAEIVVS